MVPSRKSAATLRGPDLLASAVPVRSPGHEENWFLRKDSLAPDVTSWTAGSEPKGMRKSGSVEKKCSDSARALPPSFRGCQSDPPGMRKTGSSEKIHSRRTSPPGRPVDEPKGMRKSGSAKTNVPGSLFVAELEGLPDEPVTRQFWRETEKLRSPRNDSALA